LGCADSYNGSKKCSITICLYAKVSVIVNKWLMSFNADFCHSSSHALCYLFVQSGNCNMKNFDTWQEAVINGPGCGACPPGITNC
jgi:hypothetical protein